MGRPARKADDDLVADLKRYMTDHTLTVTEVAALVGVDKSTVSRALSTHSFSRSLAAKVSRLVRPLQGDTTIEKMLHKSLHLFAASDKLRREAERMLIQALDQTTQTK